jgi:hypothetical protein
VLMNPSFRTQFSGDNPWSTWGSEAGIQPAGAGLLVRSAAA